MSCCTTAPPPSSPIPIILIMLALLLFFLSMMSGSPLPTLAQSDYYAALEMDPGESEAVYLILESINTEIAWRALHPHNLCLYGPHGLACETDPGDNRLHVVELSLGYVAENENNVACAESAAVHVAALRRLRFLRKLMFYRCFSHAEAEVGPIIWSVSDTMAHLVFMDNPALIGSLPAAAIARLRSLQRLVLVRNPRLGGPIPSEMGRLPLLQEAALSDNGLTHSIPPALGSLRALKILDLRGNRLQGPLPPALWHLKSLQKLDLSSNKLSGLMVPTLPATSIAAPLQLLDLSHNNFTGGIPGAFRKLTSVRVVDIGHNPHLGGDLPDVWSAMVELRRLSIAGSNVGGRLPPSLGLLRSLSSLDVSNNSLGGEIGFPLGRMRSLYHIDLSNNAFVGILALEPETIRRLGRNLRVGGNPGLCIGFDGDRVIPAQAAHRCPLDDAGHLLQQQDSFFFPAAMSAERSSGRRLVGLGRGVWALVVVVVLVVI